MLCMPLYAVRSVKKVRIYFTHHCRLVYLCISVCLFDFCILFSFLDVPLMAIFDKGNTSSALERQDDKTSTEVQGNISVAQDDTSQGEKREKEDEERLVSLMHLYCAFCMSSLVCILCTACILYISWKRVM